DDAVARARLQADGVGRGDGDGVRVEVRRRGPGRHPGQRRRQSAESGPRTAESELTRMRTMRSLLFLGIALAMTTTAGAQWLKLPTPGIPRLADGKPNLAAPAPRTTDGKPDFSGLWKNDGGDRLYNNIAVDLKPGDVAPWADAIYQKRKLEFGKN